MTLYLINLLDLITTHYALSLGLVELNPILRIIMGVPYLFPLVKLAVYPLCKWLEKSKAYPYLVGAYAATVAWNFINIGTVLLGGAFL